MKCKKCDPKTGGSGANTLREDVMYCDECGKQIDSTTGYPIKIDNESNTKQIL